MPTLGHLAVGLAAGRRVAVVERQARPNWTLAWFGALAAAPDIDLALQHLDLTPALVHRTATHALLSACVLGFIAGAFFRPSGVARWRAIAWAIPVLASHGLLDALCDGGRRVALLWPFSMDRSFPLWRPIPVGPPWPPWFVVHGIYTPGVEWLWSLPMLAYALWPRRRAAAGIPPS